MPENPAPELLEQGAGLDDLRRAAMSCRACPLYRDATQTVFGDGPSRAPVMVIGEQPGDEEDREGEPFVGPAGRLLDAVLEEAGIARSDVYVTNVVKHFKWEPRGKRRLHKKPNTEEVRACLPWLEAEIDLVRPRVVVCLGATASQALLGGGFRVTKQRGEFLEWRGTTVTATVHPSSVLRAPDSETRRAARQELVRDLAAVAARIGAR